MAGLGINTASGGLFNDVERNGVGVPITRPVDRDQMIQTGNLTITNRQPRTNLAYKLN